MIAVARGEAARYLTADVIQAIELADIWSKGTPPLTGGTLDQAAQFVEAARFIWHENARWRAYLMQRETTTNG